MLFRSDASMRSMGGAESSECRPSPPPALHTQSHAIATQNHSAAERFIQMQQAYFIQCGLFPLARTTVTMSKLSSSSTPGAAKVHWFRSTDFQSVVLGVVRTHILKIRRLRSLTERSIKTAFTCPGPYPDPRRADTRPPPTHIDRKLCRNLGSDVEPVYLF